MATPRAWLATIAVLSAATLVACSSEPTPPPPDRSTTTRTTTAPPTSATPTDPANQAPPVRQPLDDSEFVADPCSSLTPAQLTELHLTDPVEDRSDNAYESDEVGCAYRIDPTIDMVASVNYLPDITTGLGHVYANRPPAPTPYWTPSEIDGYPAVIRAVELDRTRCHVDVGTSDTTYVNITYYYYDWNDWDGRDPCAAATSIAAAVLTTMQAPN